MARKTKKKLNLDLEGQPDPKAPLDWQQFLAAAQPVMKLLKDDLRERAKSSASVTEALKARHGAEKEEKRTADSFTEWQDHFVEQVAAAWMLSCVFVRTLEDRGLLGHSRLAGPGASDSLKLFLEIAPSLNERDYLLTVFRELTRFPATKDLFDARHNPVWLLTPSAEGAKALVRLLQQPRADLPAFRFGQSDTGFLGWIYQDLDAHVRKRFALLQTPRFVESFILDRTLEPAIEKFGLDDTTLIDPTCGSGHFLLGAFERFFEHRLRKEPGVEARDAARRALEAVYGADINPYAVAVAAFRLTLAFLDRAGFERLKDAPALPLHVVVADSLLHNPHLQQRELGDFAPSARLWKGEEFALESDAAARAVLHRQFAAVVGNPPYITVKDAALRDRYADLYASCRMNYALTVPFMERFFQLARDGGHVGMITANSFMKREFGKELIEQYLPTVNLNLLINTSGAYIPGHGTPTVLLFGSAEAPKGAHVSTVLASRGEPSTPEKAEEGHVWRSIAAHWRQPGFENEYISVVKTARDELSKHPWSLGGGGASELKALIERRAAKRLSDTVADIGLSIIIGEDDVFIRPQGALRNAKLPTAPIVVGEGVRDWSLMTPEVILRPFDLDTLAVRASEALQRELWPWRTTLQRRIVSGSTTMKAARRAWFDVRRLSRDKLRTPMTIAFAFVATHNHFVLDRGGKVFNRTAPIIKLPATATEDDHLALLAYLNSSTAGFLLRQYAHSKGGQGVNEGHKSEIWEQFLEFSGAAVSRLPIITPSDTAISATRWIVRVADDLSAASARAFVDRALESGPDPAPLDDALTFRSASFDATLARAVSLQEELDWLIYELLGLLTPEDLAELSRARGEALPGFPRHFDPRPTEVARSGLWPGHRAFEVVLARDAGGRTQWFARNGYRLPEDLGSNYSPAYLRLIETRVRIIERNPNVRIIEQPEYKRRWAARDFRAELDEAMASAIVDAGERAVSASQQPKRCSEVVRQASDVWPSGTRELVSGVMASRGSMDVSLTQGLLGESAPFLAALRFTEDGLTKQGEWEHTWDLQRREDAGEKVENIPVPPKYAQGDYRSTRYYQLRGPLDVPKERFISYPGCESDQDHEPVYGWAGWDHEQRAKALATLYWNRKTEESWSKDRLTPMLAGLLELLPWLKQWHNEPSEDYAGDSPANYYAGFLDAECHAHGLTHDDLRRWRPPEKVRGKRAASESANGAPSPAPRKPSKKAANPAPEHEEGAPMPAPRRPSKKAAANPAPEPSDRARKSKPRKGSKKGSAEDRR